MTQFDHINIEDFVVNKYDNIKVVDEYSLTFDIPSLSNVSFHTATKAWTPSKLFAQKKV